MFNGLGGTWGSGFIPIIIYSLTASSPLPPPGTFFRITDASEKRITDSLDRRITDN